jgi:shikimate kinase
MTPSTGGPPRHLALIGMTGVGKSTAGRAVAERIGARFVDTDDVVADAAGRTLRELRRSPEDLFRAVERDTVVDALSSPDAVVLAAPCAIAVDPVMRAAVAADDVTTVYLRATPDTVLRHLGRPPAHPSLGRDPRARLEHLLEERAPRYEEVADHVVDVDHRTPAGVVALVLSVLRGEGARHDPVRC